MRPTKLANLLRTFEQASRTELSEGLAWYQNAHEEAAEIHKDIRIGAAVVAALSPGLRWERNIEAARRVIADESLDGLGVRWYDGVRKAQRIIGGASVASSLKGNKVNAFYRCILNPQNRTHVCIDGHAYSVWAGRYVTLDQTPTLTDKLYHAVANDYTVAANAVGILPHQFQAVTWGVHRRLYVKGV